MLHSTSLAVAVPPSGLVTALPFTASGWFVFASLLGSLAAHHPLVNPSCADSAWTLTAFAGSTVQDRAPCTGRGCEQGPT